MLDGMSGPTAKYRATKIDPIDKKPVSRRAHPDGYMTRGADANGPYIERERSEAATEVLHARSEFLELPRQNERYVEIIDWIANGEAILRFEERQVRPDKSDKPGPPIIDVWLVYLDIRGYVPSDSEMSSMLDETGFNRFQPLKGARL